MLLRKNENSFERVVYSDRQGRFRSGDRGKRNVEVMIHSMLKSGKSDIDISILTATEDDWELLTSRTFSKNITNREADWDCMEIFDRWYSSYKQTHEDNF